MMLIVLVKIYLFMHFIPQRPSWWPFDISPTSLAFAVVWPFVVQWLIRLYLQRRRRFVWLVFLQQNMIKSPVIFMQQLI